MLIVMNAPHQKMLYELLLTCLIGGHFISRRRETLGATGVDQCFPVFLAASAEWYIAMESHCNLMSSLCELEPQGVVPTGGCKHLF